MSRPKHEKDYVVNEDEEDEYLEERVEVRALSAKLLAAVNTNNNQ